MTDLTARETIFDGYRLVPVAIGVLICYKGAQLAAYNPLLGMATWIIGAATCLDNMPETKRFLGGLVRRIRGGDGQ